VARRPAPRRARGPRGRDRGPGAARAAVHAGGGARVRRRVTLGLAALRAAALGRSCCSCGTRPPRAWKREARRARPARCSQHGGPRRPLAGRPRHGASARGGRNHLAVRRARRRVRHAPPTDGASRLAPALDAAAARGGRSRSSRTAPSRISPTSRRSAPPGTDRRASAGAFFDALSPPLTVRDVSRRRHRPAQGQLRNGREKARKGKADARNLW